MIRAYFPKDTISIYCFPAPTLHRGPAVSLCDPCRPAQILPGFGKCNKLIFFVLDVTPVGSRAVLPPVDAGDEEGPSLCLPQDSVHP